MFMKMGLYLPALALALSALAPSGVYAQTDERKAVLSAMDRVFDAVSSMKVDDWREIQLAEGTVLSFRPLADGAPGELEMRINRNEELLADLGDDLPKFREAWTDEPTVMIRGPIAMVWGEYEFWIDGEFSHCGVNSLDFVKTDGTWKIANWVYTVEPENCPTDPSD